MENKVTVWIFVICAISLFEDTQPQSIPPTLTIPAGKTVVTLEEHTAVQTQLARGIDCTTNPPGNPVRVFLRSVSPNYPCGMGCFAVWPDQKVYALYYNPGSTPLNYDLVSSYTLQVQCTDGVSSASGNMEVRLEPNSPPVFKTPKDNLHTLDVFNSDNKAVGTVIFSASAEDPDVDAVFYRMETVPATDLFEIGRSDGQIRTTGDLRYFCRTNADFKIWAEDSHNNEAGPRVVKANFKFKDDPTNPQITSTEKVVEIREDPDHKPPGTDTVVFEPSTSPLKPSKYNWRMTAEPEKGLDYYVLENKNDKVKIRAKERLDYEYEPLRSVTLHLTANNGFCESEPYSVRIDITDVNEMPYVFTLARDKFKVEVERTVYEGLIEFHPNVTIKDPDLDENLKWELKSPTNSFYVNPITGVIYSAGEFDVDRNTEFVKRTLELEVTDKKGEKAKVTVILTILDRNDNPPEFSQTIFRRAATECSPVGKDLPPPLNAIDFDSKFQGNSRMVFSGRGTNLTVTATGHVILMNQCTAGDKETFTVYVEDQGVYPKPLKGVPSTVAFECKVCPPTTTAAPVTNPPGSDSGGVPGTGNSDGSPSGGNSGTDPGTGDHDDSDEFRKNPREFCRKKRKNKRCKLFTLANLNQPGFEASNGYDFVGVNAGWMVSSIVLTAVFLALLLYTVWRYCWHGVKAARPGVKRAPKPRVVKPKPPKPQPPPQQPPPPPPPPQLEPYNEPRMFGFWKETFPDRDQRHMPQRDTLPMNVAQDSKIDQQNKVEEYEERQQWRQERQQQVQRFQQELQQYSQQQGQQPPDASAYWYTGTTGQAVRGGTGDTILPNRQWAAKPAGGEDSAPSPGQGGAQQPAPHPSSSSTTARHLSDPALQAWYSETSVPTQPAATSSTQGATSGRQW